MKRVYLGAVAAVAAIACAVPFGVGAATPRAQRVHAHLYHVAIGVDTTFAIFSVNKFVPDRLIVHAGDSVTWTNAVPGQPQTVTFGPVENTPALIVAADASEINRRVVQPQGGRTIGDVASDVFSSGALMGGIRGLRPAYTFRFPQTGIYYYRSLFHPAMQGEIDVVAASRPASPDAPDRGSSMFDGLRSAARVLQNTASDDARSANGNSTLNTVDVGVGDNNVSIEKFTPSGLTVPLSTTVTWQTTETSGDLHALIFNPTVDDIRNAARLYTGLASDGGLLLNRAYLQSTLPSGSTVQATHDRWTSGLLYGSNVNYPSTPPASYKLMFTTPGAYQFIDPFHPGMGGELTVTAYTPSS